MLQKFLPAVGLKRFRLTRLVNAEIRLQSKHDTGITDIEVILPGRLHLIIEAKVGLNLPTFDQCKKYMKQLKSSTPKDTVERMKERYKTFSNFCYYPLRLFVVQIATTGRIKILQKNHTHDDIQSVSTIVDYE